jgi:hypothetical protein
LVARQVLVLKDLVRLQAPQFWDLFPVYMAV